MKQLLEICGCEKRDNYLEVKDIRQMKILLLFVSQTVLPKKKNPRQIMTLTKDIYYSPYTTKI